MVWAAIPHGYCSPLFVIDGNLNVQRYHDDILAHHVIPLIHNNASISIFQHNNVTSHTARDTVRFLRTTNIDFIDDWPAYSLDLSTIQYVWDSLDRRLGCRPNPLVNVNEHRQALIQEWNNIPQEEINTLVNSTRRSIQDVVIPVIKLLFLNPYNTWSKFLPVSLNSMAKIFAPNDASWNAYITIISPVCFHQVMFKQS